jgi:hypothetical protein
MHLNPVGLDANAVGNGFESRNACNRHLVTPINETFEIAARSELMPGNLDSQEIYAGYLDLHLGSGLASRIAAYIVA